MWEDMLDLSLSCVVAMETQGLSASHAPEKLALSIVVFFFF